MKQQRGIATLAIMAVMMIGMWAMGNHMGMMGGMMGGMSHTDAPAGESAPAKPETPPGAQAEHQH